MLAAPDSFKGTATSSDVAAAIAEGARRSGWTCDTCPMSDGGEGFAEVLAPLGGEIVEAAVTGPLGGRVTARWRHTGNLAVIECAEASGLVLVGGPEGNDPLAASSRGTGELVARAVALGARRVLVGLGGSATTDGGTDAVSAIEEAGGLRGAEVIVACDVTTAFLDAAKVFGPQKGASPAQVELLSARLAAAAERYRALYGVDVTTLTGAGAAGGLAGGLAALGAKLVPGFQVVARALDLERRIGRADLVVTGEGRLDLTSWSGKVVGGVTALAAAAGAPVLVVAGSVAPGVAAGASAGATGGAAAGASAGATGGQDGEPALQVASLEDRFGIAAAMADPARCVREIVAEHLRSQGQARA